MHQAGDPLDLHKDVRMMERVYVVNGDESMLRGIRFVCDADGVRYFFSDCVVLLNDMSHDWYIDDTELNHYCFREGRFTGAQFDSACLSLSNLSLYKPVVVGVKVRVLFGPLRLMLFASLYAPPIA